MNLASGVTTAKTAVTAGELAHKGWGWISKWWYGTVSITHPQNRAVVQPASIELEGTHNNPKRGHFWLGTRNGQGYWLKTRIQLHPDGHWKEKINIGGQVGPRICTVLLVWVTDFIDALLADIKERSKIAKNWDPVNMVPVKSQFSVVQSLVLHVQ